MRRVVQWLSLVVLRFAAFAVFAVFCNTVACGREASNEPLPGVRLGMAPRDVRDRFEDGREGSWQTKVGGGTGASDDTVVEWSAASEKSRASTARFEFHLGMLVAVRAHLREGLAAERVDLTPKTVTVRTPGPAGTGGTDVTMLARDCPTHREEAESLAAKAVK
jgi:hypothetical protein